MTSSYLRTILASMLLLASHHLATACGFHSAAEDNFTALHPRSIDVAIALGDATQAGILQRAEPPTVGDASGYRNIMARMQRLGNAVAPTGDATAPGFSVLLVESGLWSRYRSLPEGAIFEIHTEGAQAGETAVITGATVLEALESGVLSFEGAMERGLIVIATDMSADSQKILSALAAFAKADDSDQMAFTPPDGACWPN